MFSQPGHPISSRYKWIVLTMTSLGAFMGSLDGNIVSVSLPVIAANLRIGYAIVIWIPVAYLLARSIFLLSIGRLSDIRGRRKIFLYGFVVFVISSFLCSISRSGIQLMSFRFLEGVGGAFISATSTAIVTDTFPSGERGKALGINTMAVYSGVAVGPSLGGFLTYLVGWPSIFYINIPIGVFVIILGISRLKESAVFSNRLVTAREQGSLVRGVLRFDIAGAAAFSVGLILLLVTLTLGGSIYPWQSVWIIMMGVLSAILLSSFILIEIHTKRSGKVQPMIDISLFTRNRLFAAANLSALVIYVSIYGVSFLISFYLQRALDLTPFQAGLVLLIMPVAMIILSPLVGSLSDRIGSRVLSTSGMATIAVGLIVLSIFLNGNSLTIVYIGLLMLGVGIGLFSAPNTSAVMGSVGSSARGVASGTIATMRVTGQSLSLAFMGAIVTLASGSNAVSSLFMNSSVMGGVEIAAYTSGMKEAFLISGLVAIVGALLSMVRGGKTSENASYDILQKP